jgi:hypothetical protein
VTDPAKSDSPETDGGKGKVPLLPRRISIATRWLVPCLFITCFSVVLLDHVESLRRVHFAEYLAKLLRENLPADLSALEALLGEHVVETGRRPGDVGKGEPDVVWFELKPALWLSLNANVKPPADQLGEVRIIALSSTVLPVDDPAAAMSLPDLGSLLILTLIAFAGSAVGYWGPKLAKSRLMDFFMLLITVLLLVPLLLGATIGLMRIAL